MPDPTFKENGQVTPEELVARASKIITLTEIDLSIGQLISNQGGEAVVRLAPANYRPPNGERVDPNKVVIKILRNKPAGAQDVPMAIGNILFFWGKYAPPIQIQPQFRQQYPGLAESTLQTAALSLALGELLPQDSQRIQKTFREFDRTYGSEQGLVAKLNQIAQGSEVKIKGQPVRIGKIFPDILQLGLTTAGEWFIAMERVDKIILNELPRNTRYLTIPAVKFATYQEAYLALHIREATAHMAIAHELGYAFGDFKPDRLALMGSDLVQIDHSLIRIGTPLLFYTDRYLPPQVRADLKSGRARFPTASVRNDRFALEETLDQAVTSGLF